jgi:hypothetical protein
MTCSASIAGRATFVELVMISLKFRFPYSGYQPPLYRTLPIAALALLWIGSYADGETWNADEDPTKPIAGVTKPSESGVSIKLKLLPGNQSGSKPAANKEIPSEESSQKKPADEKSDKKVDAKGGSPSNDSKPNATEKSESKPDTAAKKTETGTVDLKLVTPKLTEEKKTEEKPAGSVEMTIQPPEAVTAKSKVEKPTGTVDISLQTPKEKKPAPAIGNVTIELVQPPARRAISDSDDSSKTGPAIGELKSPAVARKSTTGNLNNSDEPIMDLDAEPEAAEESAQTQTNPNDEPSETKPGNSRDGDPGDPGDGEAKPLPAQPGDVPLVQDAHPLDVPVALATEGESRFRSHSIVNDTLDSDSGRERDRRIEEVLDYFRTHSENVVRRGPWALMHAILPFGVETEVIAGKRQVNAIGWLCFNGIAAKQRMFQPTQTGFRTNVGPGVQGHEGQFLAILAQSHVQVDYPIQIGNKKYTIRDLVKYEMATCREKSELTFKLIGFSHYLKPQQTWRDNRGRPWSMEKLVAEELAQPINGEACGGTHRLMGLTCAVVSRQEAGLPITGHFERAQRFLNDFVEYTFSLQNPDGSFSTEWFERRAEEPNMDRKIQTTGHILEWLVYVLPDDQLKSPEIEKAVDFLLNTIGNDPSRDWPIGPRGHSLRALSLYQRRVFKSQQQTAPANVATEPTGKAMQR